MRKTRKFIPNPGAVQPGGQSRPCAHESCVEAGEFPAPRSPQELDSYYWFCLIHVREYNRAWNYYAGLSPEEIEAQIQRDTVWQRPTWPMGGNTWHRFRQADETIEEFLDRLAGERAARDRTSPFGRVDTPEARALATLDLQPPVSSASLKARYKALVKRYHPDANGGDRSAEDKLKGVIEAYATLKTSVLS